MGSTNKEDPTIQQSEREPTGQVIADLKWRQGYTWTEIDDLFPKWNRQTLRSRASRYKEHHPEQFEVDTPFDVDPQDLGIHIEEHGNYAEATSLSTQIKNVEELIEASGIDVDLWMPTEPVVIKSHDGWRANTKKHLVC